MIIRCCRALVVLLSLSLSLPLAAASDPFPFGATLMLDAAPIRGSKRIPMLEIAEDGAVSIDLWCATARAKAVVSEDSITIALWDSQVAQCEPERQARDAELLAALGMCGTRKNRWGLRQRSPIAAFPGRVEAWTFCCHGFG
jgi:hypothetical protein